MLHHRVPILWTFHRVHHSPTTLNATSGLRMHIVDFVQLAFLPTVLFSVVFDLSSVPAWFLPTLLMPGVVFDAFEHGNLPFDVRRPVQRLWDRVLNNPHFHAWHHTSDGHLRDGNYGNVLTVWDRLFGTCVSTDDLPEAMGLDASSTLRNGVLPLQALVAEDRELTQ
jgi:sterol desaturase/sphingolipid hydroxylase (fatty acid hydroxylase superfamily)